jgi:hypothetical protein
MSDVKEKFAAEGFDVVARGHATRVTIVALIFVMTRDS